MKKFRRNEWARIGRQALFGLFVFVCFTALSFIDVKNLTTDNIVDIK